MSGLALSLTRLLERTRAIDQTTRLLWRGLASSGILVAIGKLLFFLMWVALARWLNPSEYGALQYAYALVTVLTVVTGLGMPFAAVRFVAEYEVLAEWPLFRGFLIWTFAGLSWLSLIVAAGLASAAEHLPLPLEVRDGLSYAALLLPPMVLSVWRSQVLRAYRRFVASILPKDVLFPLGVLTLGSIVAPVDVRSAVWMFTGVLLAAECVGLAWVVKRTPVEATRVQARYRGRQWLGTSLPMVVSHLMQQGLTRWDLLLLGALAGMGTTGVYAAAVQVSLVSGVVLQTVNTVVSPMIAGAHFGERRKEVQRVIRSGIGVSGLAGIPVFLAIVAWPEELLGLFGQSFQSGATVLRILAIGQLVNLLTGPVGTALWMTGNQRVHAKLMLAATILNLAGNAVAIPCWGMTGAAVVSAASITFANVGLLLATRRHLLGSISTAATRSGDWAGPWQANG